MYIKTENIIIRDFESKKQNKGFLPLKGLNIYKMIKNVRYYIVEYSMIYEHLRKIFQ